MIRLLAAAALLTLTAASAPEPALAPLAFEQIARLVLAGQNGGAQVAGNGLMDAERALVGSEMALLARAPHGVFLLD